MKKTVKIIIAGALFTFFGFEATNCNAQTTANSSILHRTNITLSANSLPSPNFFFGGGLLKGHPDRCIDMMASFRIWQHLEIGGHLSLQGASATGFSGVTQFSTAPNVDYYYLGWDDNNYHLGGGVMMQLHLVGFDNRLQRNNSTDLVLRGGWGRGAQVDGFWFGVSEDIRVYKQAVIFFAVDYGNFPFAYIKQIADDESQWRFSVGIKVSLK